MESQVGIGVNGLFGVLKRALATVVALRSVPTTRLKGPYVSTDDGKEPQDLLASIWPYICIYVELFFKLTNLTFSISVYFYPM